MHRLGRGRNDDMVTDSFVLVHAPVLGPATWSPVAAELARHGHQVTVPALAGFADAGPPYVERLIDWTRAELGHPGAGLRRSGAGRVVLVVHSGAGVFAPYLAEAAGADAVIFADASLPPPAPDQSALDQPAPDQAASDGAPRVIDTEFLPFLQGIAADGIVPPWPRWWPAEELAPLYPDDATRALVNVEAAALPLAFFEELLPAIPPSWRTRQRAYLRFSEGYAETARQAGALGWPVRELPGEHLHMLVDPAGVATALNLLAMAVQSG
jgi:hypothetical protein